MNEVVSGAADGNAAGDGAAGDEEARRALVRAAQDGDAGALEELVASVRDEVFRLALRMLAHPQDAEDACQEILIKVITRLGEFRGEAALRTWVYRVAVNHLLDFRKSRVESLSLDFDAFAADLMDGLAADGHGDAALAEEVRRGCTLAMLTCLDREHRLAFILADVFDVEPALAARICDIAEPALRQRLSRARRALQEFTESWCGIANARAPCRCSKRVTRALELGRLQGDGGTMNAAVAQMTDLHESAALMRARPDYRAPERMNELVHVVLARRGPLL